MYYWQSDTVIILLKDPRFFSRGRIFTICWLLCNNENYRSSLSEIVYNVLCSPLTVTYLLHAAESFFEKLIGFKPVKKFPAFYGIRRFITTFKSALHLSLSSASSIQSIPPHPTSWRSILILSFYLRLVLPSGLFPSGFPTKTLYAPFLSSTPATFSGHLILLDLITRTILGEQYRSLSSFLCSCLHSPRSSLTNFTDIYPRRILINKYRRFTWRLNCSSAFMSGATG